MNRPHPPSSLVELSDFGIRPLLLRYGNVFKPSK